MKGFFSGSINNAKPISVDPATLAVLIKPRHDMIDKKHTELTAALLAHQNEVLSPPNSDQDILSKIKQKRPVIRQMVADYEKYILKSEAKSGSDYSRSMDHAAHILDSLDGSQELSYAEKLKYRFKHLQDLLDEATVTAKEQASMAVLTPPAAAPSGLRK